MALENGLTLSLGVKAWAPDVTWGSQGLSGVSSKNPSPALGLSASARYKQFSVGLNYTPGSFEFGNVTRVSPGGAPSLKQDMAMDRLEKDLFVGYNATKNFALVVGKKFYDTNIYIRNVTDAATGIPLPAAAETNNYSFTGNFYGVAGHTDLIEGNMMFFFTYSRSKTEDSNTSTSLRGPATEIGGAYVLPRYNSFFSLSIRNQKYAIHDADGTESNSWEFSGLIASANMSF